jgi:hypothetical protein
MNKPTVQSDTLAAESAAHWEALAANEIAMADHYDSIGNPYGSTVAYRNRAQTYRETARALRLEAETGKPHCNLCFGDHPNHLHGHRG